MSFRVAATATAKLRKLPVDEGNEFVGIAEAAATGLNEVSPRGGSPRRATMLSMPRFLAVESMSGVHLPWRQRR